MKSSLKKLNIDCYFPGDIESAIIGLTSLRKTLEVARIPVEFHAITWNKDLTSLFQASWLFRKISIVEDYQDRVHNRDEDTSILLEPDYSLAMVYSEQRARDKIERIKKMDPDFPDDIGEILPWDKLWAMTKQIVDLLCSISGKKINYVPDLDYSPNNFVNKDILPRVDRWLSTLPGNWLYFILTDMEDLDLDSVPIGNLNYKIIDLNSVPLREDEKLALFQDSGCLGFIGRGWGAWASWAEDLPIQVHLVEENPQWNGMHSRKATVIQDKNIIDNDIVPQIGNVVDRIVEVRRKELCLS